MISASRLAEASAVRPTPRQLAWQRLEFYGFIHFGMNTMTEREWGLGHEDPALFDPAGLDADQWVESLASAGMRGLILTCKHHDGFCLWPSAVTRHSVASSPWRAGRGDLVAEVSAACARRGMKFGVYLSPWDRTEPSYGTGSDYDGFFVAQLRELLSGYGPIFSVWFDGANGEGAGGRKQYYDWDRYFAVVRELQPGAVISVCGPDVRWCGNEAGQARPNEWSVVPASLRDAERTASNSQQVDDGKFSRQVRSDEQDLGSRAAIAASNDELVWYPAEVNTSIRPGWFHHPREDAEVRSAEELFDIYCGSVGGNATFLLNVPPDRSGRVATPDRLVLAQLGQRIADFYAADISPQAIVSPSDALDQQGAWIVDGAGSSIVLTWPEPRQVGAAVFEEDISLGQQVERLLVETRTAEGQWLAVAETSSVGYRRIVSFSPIETGAVRFSVTGTRGRARLRFRIIAAEAAR
ncbi:alpha-L-fucosidase [Devosia sp. A16]|uniref:alpha-L-fucosidase n=1 Tax=Devosia sp. A16 TaxID=1736675 RepID=UPI0006D7CB5B|nr:alpha-L-fucosidase [Devosia sp. A16]